MKKISSLTEEQKLQIPIYQKKWIDMPLKPMDKEVAFSSIYKLYEMMGKSKPQIIIGQSPFQTALMVLVCSKLKEPIVSQSGSQLESQLRSQLRSQLDHQLKKINTDWYLVTGWEPFCSWIDYSKYIGVSFDEHKFKLLTDFSREVCFIIPYKGICFISEKPVEINWKDRLLHKDGGMSVKYSDDWGIYTLNGTPVPEYLAITPEGQLDIEFFKKEKNADVKAEFIRKFGIARMKHLGKVIDTWRNYSDKWYEKSEYELWDMSCIFTSHKYAPFLWMKNQTTQTVHLEGVDPKIKTLKEALDYRFNNRSDYKLGVIK